LAGPRARASPTIRMETIKWLDGSNQNFFIFLS
jgi:hypothetical protein